MATPDITIVNHTCGASQDALLDLLTVHQRQAYQSRAHEVHERQAVREAWQEFVARSRYRWQAHIVLTYGECTSGERTCGPQVTRTARTVAVERFLDALALMSGHTVRALVVAEHRKASGALHWHLLARFRCGMPWLPHDAVSRAWRATGGPLAGWVWIRYLDTMKRQDRDQVAKYSVKDAVKEIPAGGEWFWIVGNGSRTRADEAQGRLAFHTSVRRAKGAR